jgi:hypothetical protein
MRNHPLSLFHLTAWGWERSMVLHQKALHSHVGSGSVEMSIAHE